MTLARFRRLIWRYYKVHGRHGLPWRKTHNVYNILVSEVMLQQTQVKRVIPFYKKFIKKFPTARRLAEAPLSEVLKSWQGLGYNRRAKMLHEAAKELPRLNLNASSKRFNLVAELEKLPGVGPYTARAVAAFANNEDVVFLETNIRTAITHHFFIRNTFIYESISDAHIEATLEELLPKGQAREWYSALMDYGAHLKRSGVSHNTKSKNYMKQSKFAGSLREARGAIVRELVKTSQKEAQLVGLLGISRMAQMGVALEALVAERLVTKKRGRFVLSDQ